MMHAVLAALKGRKGFGQRHMVESEVKSKASGQNLANKAGVATEGASQRRLSAPL
jgi:hypothetical protein